MILPLMSSAIYSGLVHFSDVNFQRNTAWVVFAEGLLGVSVRRNVAHRTSATALGFGRCRHCKDVCSLVCRTTALYLRCCSFLRSESKLRRLDAHSECNAVLARALLNAKERAKPNIRSLSLNRIDCHITLCKPKAR